ncbi:hypothetical protein NDU88_006330 [Pleurodeles waltl]|uniref:Uncharacterized protein n=1 Tax=Pleurodeles waltl TaxID=8319 RepID=A0AAV7VQQ0_PLEWA|nr:hypothetical protein NDU88_006330 [Pleurodeles waltl]
MRPRPLNHHPDPLPVGTDCQPGHTCLCAAHISPLSPLGWPPKKYTFPAWERAEHLDSGHTHLLDEPRRCRGREKLRFCVWRVATHPDLLPALAATRPWHSQYRTAEWRWPTDWLLFAFPSRALGPLPISSSHTGGPYWDAPKLTPNCCDRLRDGLGPGFLCLFLLAVDLTCLLRSIWLAADDLCGSR